MKEAWDNNKICAAILTDLSKAFDCFLPELLIEKLHAFGFDLKSLRIIHAYLNDWIQVTKVGSFYNEILQFFIYSVPQVSILAPLLFNVNIPFPREALWIGIFSNYTDDTTPHNCRSKFLETLSDLKITLDNLFNWFCYNNFKANVTKCHIEI